MHTTIEVFVGAPIEHESERRFLASLCGDLQARGHRALVLANFHLSPHQIDFLVILEHLVCHIELKEVTVPIIGAVNGPWHLVLPDGTKRSMYGNPYRQALECKFAVSDQMHRHAGRKASIAEQANGKKFYKTFDSFVCVSPDILPGSIVPGDYKVRVLGYRSLLEHLNTASRNPGWSWQEWTAFAMDLGLVRQAEFTRVQGDSEAAAAELLATYCTRFHEFHGSPLGNLVPTTLEVAGKQAKSDEYRSFFATGSHGQLFGPSGSGKSLHVLYMAVDAIRSGRLPIVARAGEYDGRLSVLLDRSVAHLCPRTATEFVDAARRLGKPLTLVIDGYNKCPVRLQDKLLRDLQAAFLRWEVPIIITAQEDLRLPASLSGTTLRFRDPNEDERRLILERYAQQSLPAHVDLLCKPFRSAYELSIAASCLAELGRQPTRSRLFEAYLRRCCGDRVAPNLTRRLLSEVADAMRVELRSTLSVHELWHVSERVLDAQSMPLSALQHVIDCGLISVRQGQCRFRHELLQRYFEAVALMRSAPDLATLTNTLKKPARHDVIELVLGMQTESDGIRACLAAAAGVRSTEHLFADCLQGRFGDQARETTIGDSRAMLNRAQEDLECIGLELTRDEEKLSPYMIQVRGHRDWSSYDYALMNAIAASLAAGMFIEEALHLVDETERRCTSLLEKQLGAEAVAKRSFKNQSTR